MRRRNLPASEPWLLTKTQEPRTKNQEPRTKNQEPRTKNQEPRTKNQTALLGSWNLVLGSFIPRSRLPGFFVLRFSVPRFFNPTTRFFEDDRPHRLNPCRL